MKKLRIVLGIAIALTLGLGAPCSAFGSQLWFQFGPVESADIVTLNYAAAGLNGGEYYAGQYLGTIASTQAALTSGPNTKFQTFCVDLFHDVSNYQQYQVTPTSTSALNDGAQVNYLYRTYGTNQITGTYATLVVDGHTYHNVAANDYAAALQLAIWEELANNGSTSGPFSYGLVTGNSSMVSALLSSFLDEANHQTNLADGIYLQSSKPTDPQAQSFIITPAPSTLLLSTLALSCVCSVGFWRSRRMA